MKARTSATVRSGPVPMTILVVEDDDVLRRVLTRVLERDGHTVVTAATATLARQLAEQHTPHLVLIDCSLPAGHGVELAQAMRARDDRLPLVLMTGYPSPETANPIPNGGFATVVREPFDLEDLRKTIEALLLA